MEVYKERATGAGLLELLVDGKKAMSPDEILGQVLKHCNEQLVEPVHDIISCLIKTDAAQCSGGGHMWPLYIKKEISKSL